MNTKEYNIVVRQWSAHLLRFANAQFRDIDQAKDTVQDAFVVLWDKHENIEAVKAKQFLFSVVYNKCMDVFRQSRPKTEISELHFGIQMDSNFESTYSDKEFLQRALRALPNIQQQLILLRDLEGYDYKEIGEITELSESQVKVYLFRARKNLKEIIRKLEAI